MADRQQVLLPLADWFGGAPALTGAIRELIAAREARVRALEREEARVHRALMSAAVEHAFIKGRSLARLQARARSRQMSDLDVVVRRRGDLGAVASALAGLGYSIEAMSLRWAGPNDWSGAVYFTSPQDLEIEVQFADLTVYYWHPGLTFTPDFWAELDRSSGFPYPSRRWSAAVLAAEMVERGRLTLRDRLDAHAVFSGLTDADLEWLADLARAQRLRAELRLLGAVCPALRGGKFDAALRALRAASPSLGRLMRVLPAGVREAGPLRLARTAIVSTLRDWAIEPIEDRRAGPVIRGLAACLNSSETGRIAQGAGYLFLIPLLSSRAGAWRIDQVGDSWVATTPAGSFHATFLPAMSEQEVAELRGGS